MEFGAEAGYDDCIGSWGSAAAVLWGGHRGTNPPSIHFDEDQYSLIKRTILTRVHTDSFP